MTETFRECFLSYDQSQQISRRVSLPENHNLIYHLCLWFSFSHTWCSFFFCYNTCSRNISGVCLGLWFVSKKIEAKFHLFNLLGNIHFCENGIHIWHVEIFLPISQNPSCLGMFWKFPCPSQIGYQNTSTGQQGRHQKWQLRMGVSH